MIQVCDRLYWTLQGRLQPAENYFLLCSEDKYRYRPFRDDFGPFDIATTIQYCRDLKALLTRPALTKVEIVHYSSTEAKHKTNSVFLICAYQILELHRTAHAAWELFKALDLVGYQMLGSPLLSALYSIA